MKIRFYIMCDNDSKKFVNETLMFRRNKNESYQFFYFKETGL